MSVYGQACDSPSWPSSSCRCSRRGPTVRLAGFGRARSGRWCCSSRAWLCWLRGASNGRSGPWISGHGPAWGPGAVDQCHVHVCANKRDGRCRRSRARIRAVAANAMLYSRVLVATAILNPAVVPPLVPYLVAPALVATLVAVVGARRSAAAGAPDVSVRNPLQLAAALQMAVLFQAVLMAVHLVGHVWGAIRCVYVRSGARPH